MHGSLEPGNFTINPGHAVDGPLHPPPRPPGEMYVDLDKTGGSEEEGNDSFVSEAEADISRALETMAVNDTKVRLS